MSGINSRNATLPPPPQLTICLCTSMDRYPEWRVFPLKSIWIRSIRSSFSLSLSFYLNHRGSLCRWIIRSCIGVQTNLTFLPLVPLDTHTHTSWNSRDVRERGYECVIAVQSTLSSINELASIYLLLHHWSPYFSLSLSLYLSLSRRSSQSTEPLIYTAARKIPTGRDKSRSVAGPATLNDRPFMALTLPYPWSITSWARCSVMAIVLGNLWPTCIFPLFLLLFFRKFNFLNSTHGWDQIVQGSFWTILFFFSKKKKTTRTIFVEICLHLLIVKVRAFS